MPGLPDEDVPTMSSVELKALVGAETGAPRAPPGAPAAEPVQPDQPDQEDNEDRTVQAMVEPAVTPTQTPAVTPRPAPPRPAAGASAGAGAVRGPLPPPKPASEDEEEHDSITATAPRLRDSQLGLSIPSNVQIRTVNSDDLVDETEVATLTGSGEILRAMADAAAQEQEDDDDDGPTTQAVAPSLDATPEAGSPVADDDDDEPNTTQAQAPRSAGHIPISAKSVLGDDTGAQSELVTRPGVASGELPTHPGLKELPTKTGVDAVTKPGVTARSQQVYDADAEESITSRAMASVDAYEDDSVTTQAPLSALAAIAAGEMPTMDRRPDDTDATTQKKAKPPAVPADEEQESITTQAPGHLTNMLRVIAAEPRRPSSIDGDEEDELPENRTAVMASAPMMKHGTLQGMGPVGSIGPRGAAAPRLQPDSESGLRVARDQAASGEHASLGVIGAADPRGSLSRLGDGVRSDGRIVVAGAEPAFPPPPLLLGEEPPAPGAPSYALLVGVVAAICVAVPIALFVYLRSSAEEAGPLRTPSQIAPDIVGRSDAVRGKATKGAPAPSSKKAPFRR